MSDQVQKEKELNAVLGKLNSAISINESFTSRVQSVSARLNGAIPVSDEPKGDKEGEDTFLCKLSLEVNRLERINKDYESYLNHLEETI